MDVPISFKRLESVRVIVHEMILTMDSAFSRQEAYVHLHGVSTVASMLAAKRGQSQELAAIAGLLHEYYGYKTGIREFPGINSAEAVRPILRDLKMFTKEEQTTILKAIFNHEDKNKIHGAYEEILKDARVFQLFFHQPNHRFSQPEAVRLQKVLHELSFSDDITVEVEEVVEHRIRRETLPGVDRRSRLADIAQALAAECIIGEPGDERYREICRYWPDTGIYKVLQSSWCAAFVYHCCRQAGWLLPIRYPNGMCRFAGVGAWLEWARLPETGYFYYDGQDQFIPQRGDIVIYEKLLTDESHDHIGIVLACNDNELWVAEGNRDNENYSSVFFRNRRHCILGYIRIDNYYDFTYDGAYNPIN